MATTKFYDITLINKATGAFRSFHVTNAPNKPMAVDSCIMACLQEYQKNIDIMTADYVSYNFNGIKVTAMPVDSALRMEGQKWSVYRCDIQTFAGRYSKKRNPDGSKKRKRDAKKQATTVKKDANTAAHDIVDTIAMFVPEDKHAECFETLEKITTRTLPNGATVAAA